MRLLVAKALLASACAYLVPTGILLHQMASQRAAQLPGTFEVQGTLTVFGEEARRTATALGVAAQDPLVLPARLAFTPGKCTLETQGPHGSVVNDRGQVSPKDAPTATAWLVRLGCLPFLFRGDSAEAGLEGAMRRAGGGSDNEAGLTFEAGEVAYVLGAGEDGAGKTGLVVAKRGFTPLRLWENEGGTKLETVFRDYRPAFHDSGFPAQIELRAAGMAVARFNAAGSGAQ